MQPILKQKGDQQNQYQDELDFEIPDDMLKSMKKNILIMYEQIRNLNRKIESIQKWKCENWKINLKENKS